MFEAQMVIVKEEAYSLYSPWFPRGAENMRATIELVSSEASNTIKAEIVTKNSEDSGDGGAPVSGSVTATGSANDTASFEWMGLAEELVRYKFTVGGGTAGQWILFRMHPPVWFSTVDA